MRILFILTCAFVFFNCKGESDTNEVTGNVMEIEPSQTELDEIALGEQPQTIQDFFALENDLIGNDFCYNYSSISQLILYGHDSSEEWEKFEVSDNYLTAYHDDCDVLLEFMTFELDGEKKAFLSQTNNNSQQFDYLHWNSKTNGWTKTNHYPQPEMNDYFANLSPSEHKLVNEYGSDYIYINPKTETVTYVFSEWEMLMNMGEKQQLEFEKPPDYYFELETSESILTLNRTLIKTDKQLSHSYIVACSVLGNSNQNFSTNYETLVSEIADEKLEHQLTTYSSNDFRAYFPSDTLILRTPEQNDPVDAFWLFEEGKEPLMIDAKQNITLIVQEAKNYFETEY